jgi:hypothetical protein
MCDRSQLALEARARRTAKRNGYKASKSKWRRGSVDNYGGFMLVDPYTSFPVAGQRWSLTAEEVIDWFNTEQNADSH